MNAAWVFGLAGLIFTLLTHAITWGMFRQKVEELRTRVAKLEADMSAVTETRKDVAVLTERFSGFQTLWERGERELRHDVKNIASGMDLLAKEIRERRGG